MNPFARWFGVIGSMAGGIGGLLVLNGALDLGWPLLMGGLACGTACAVCLVLAALIRD